MDPVTQGVVGAAAGQAVAKKSHMAWAALCGGLAGMAADLDILIRSSHDPLLALEYHRHFTHSLFFIPLGGLLCAVVFYFGFAKKKELRFQLVTFWSIVGYATHGLLDGCTSYGTQLLWPFSRSRFSIDIVSVIDPLFTLPALLALLLAARLHNKTLCGVAILWGLAYLSVGAIQHQRALALGQQLAASRGHQPLRLEAKPSFANLIVWKVIYELPDAYYVDAVRPGWGAATVWSGTRASKPNVQALYPWLNLQSQQAQDIERFRWFSQGFIAQDSEDPNRLVDIRYSLVPNEIRALWGITLDPNADMHAHVAFNSSHRRSGEAAAKLWQMILGVQ